MPAAGANQRQIREAASRPAPRLAPAPAYHAPMVYAPRPATPAPRAFGSFPSSHPFAQAQHQAAQRVQQAQRQLPQQRLYAPQLPAVPSPTQGQQYTAFAEAKRFQEQHIGASPGRQRELQFHREVAADPRNAGFIQALAHYIHAARIEGGTRTPFELAGEGGARNVIDAAVSAAQGISPRDRMGMEADERRFQREGQQMLAHEARERADNAGAIATPFGTINPTHLAALKIPGISGILGKLANEAIDIPGQTFLAGEMGGAATRQAIEGKPGGAEYLGGQLLQQIEHPLRTFEQAPLATALMFAGGENALGRLLGKVGRTGIAGDRVAQAFSRARPDLRLYGEGVPNLEAGAGAPGARRVFIGGQQGLEQGIRVSGRQYNADPLRAGLQKLYERKVLPNLPGDLAQRDPFQATGWRLKREVAGGAFHVGAADIHAAAGERGRRGMVRGTVNTILGPVANGGVNAKVGRDAIPLIVQRIVRTPATLGNDLMKEREKLAGSLRAAKEDGTPLYTGADRGTIKANLERVHGLLEDKAFLKDPSEAFKAAERYNTLQKPLVAARLFGGQIKEDQLRAALFPYAQAHMDARYFTAADHAAAEDAAIARGEPLHALSVGGRDPTEVQYHQHLEGELERAKGAIKPATGEVAKQQRRLDRLQALQQSARARGGRPLTQSGREAAERVARANAEPGKEIRVEGTRGPRGATAKEKELLGIQRAKLGDAKQALRARQQEALDARDAVAEHKLPDRQPGMRGPHGEQLTNQMILDHMREAGVGAPGFLSHQRGVGGRFSYFRSILRQPALERFNRTGAAFAAGTADHSWESLVGTIAKHASEAAQLEGRRRTLNRFGIGQHETAREAELARENFHDSPEGQRLAANHSLGELRTVHMGSQQIVDKGHIAPVPHGDVLHQFGLDEHVTAAHRELGRYTNVPESVLQRLEAHDTALNSKFAGGRALQAYQSAFRRAKLNTSMPHQFGVLQEQAIRLAAEQAGPTARAVGAKYDRVLKQVAEVDKHGYIADSHGPLGEHYRAFENTIGGRGGLVDSQRWQDAVRKSDQFQESLLHYAFAGGEKALAANPGKLLAKGWHGWRVGFEGSLAAAERASYHAHLGKALRESGLIDNYRSVLKAQDDAIKAMIDGRMNQNMADALARRVDNMMGNWTHQTPAVRTFVGKWAPFGLWWLNSMRWLYRLPVSHPIKTGILAALYSTTKAKRNSEGQGYGAPHPVPGFLQGTIGADLPLVGHVKVAPSYYSPGGTLGAQFGQTATEQLLPALQSIIFAARGQNSLSGERLKGPHGEDIQPGQVGLNTVAEALAGPTPFATQAQTLLQRGGKPFGTANWITDLAHALGAGPPTVKPGTEHSLPEQLGKMISPTRVIRPKAPAASSHGVLDAGQQQAIKEAVQEGRHELSDPATKQAIKEAREEGRLAR